MFNALKISTVLISTDTPIPDAVWVETENFCSGWEAITNLNGEDLDRKIREDRWSLMFIAGALRGTSWGSWSGTAIRCAAIRVLKKTKAKKFNAFEITDIQARRFLGVPHVIVTGHSRHIKKSTILQNIAERIHQAALVPGSTVDQITIAPLPLPAPAIGK